MQYIIVDLEWNQASRLPGNIDPPYPLTGEIIQIGAVKLDEQQHIIDRFQKIVKPVYYCAMHPNVQQLTGIEETLLATGIPFAEAIAALQSWAKGGCETKIDAKAKAEAKTEAKEEAKAPEQTERKAPEVATETVTAPAQMPVWFSWGLDDRLILKENLELFELDKGWMESWYDLQMIYRFQKDPSPNQAALKTAMEAFALLPPENLGEAHNAFFDAYCAGMIGEQLDLKLGIEQSKQYFLEHPPKQSNFLARTTVRGCKSHHAAYEAGRQLPLSCPRCQAPLEHRQPWVCEKKNHTSFATLQRCSNEACTTRKGRSEYFVRLKLIHNVNGNWQAVLLIYSATHSLVSKYILKKRSEEKRNALKANRKVQSQ